MLKFIIYTPNFDTNSGGAIVLHLLCDLLNKTGHEAKLWTMGRKVKSRFPRFIETRLFNKKNQTLRTYPHFNTPFALASDLTDDSIVIYPEIIDGNPLNAKRVVRWLLHKPGFHTGRINYNDDELLMGFGKPCSGSGYTITEENSLIVKLIMTDVYKNHHNDQRKGTCYMVRKGTNKAFVHEEDAICVDHLDHDEMSKVFNQCERFISYDPYTYYTTYAALCGCDSIVIPDDGISKAAWYPEEKDRYGKAYGISDIQYARDTLPLLMEYIQEQQQLNFVNVEKLVKLCRLEWNI